MHRILHFLLENVKKIIRRLPLQLPPQWGRETPPHTHLIMASDHSGIGVRVRGLGAAAPDSDKAIFSGKS